MSPLPVTSGDRLTQKKELVIISIMKTTRRQPEQQPQRLTDIPLARLEELLRNTIAQAGEQSDGARALRQVIAKLKATGRRRRANNCDVT